MKLVMTLMVRDEEDILKDNIDFHLSQGVDFIIATDNCSVDSTKDILNKYENEGKLFYVYEGNDNMDKSKWVTRMARMAVSDYGADWVINNDADEFWWPRENTLKKTFESLPSKSNVVQARRHNFVHVHTEDDSIPFYETMIFRDVISLNPIGNPLPPKQAHVGDRNVVVDQGNHSVDGIRKRNIAEGEIEIFHFPIRNHKQVLNKIVKMGAAYARNTQLPKGVGNARKTLYSEYMEKGNIDRYYQSQSYDEARLSSELHAGKIVEDTRLKKYLTNLYGSAFRL
jgi:hypothetical protein